MGQQNRRTARHFYYAQAVYGRGCPSVRAPTGAIFLAGCFLYSRFLPLVAMSPRSKLIREGIEPHPGPTSNMRTIEFLNTSYGHGQATEHIHNRCADIFIGNEHSGDPIKVNKTTKFLAKLKWKSLFSCLDPELVHHTGGVFAQAKKPFNIYNVKPNTKAATKLLESGRFGMYGVELGTNLHTIIFTCYGWTDGRGNQLARERTDNMCKIIYYESQTHPGVPMLLTGDLNCSRELLPHLDLLINDLHWTDVGANAEMWGGSWDSTG